MASIGLQWGSVSAAASRLQGMFTPVQASGRGVRRSGTAWMGTPEIFFAKNIDNSRLVKVNDPQRAKEIAGFFASVAVLFVLAILYAFQHFGAIESGYQIESMKHHHEELLEANRALRLEEASLRDPERIDVLARQMGLQSPRAGQVLRIDGNSEATTPVMAQATSIAALTMAQ